MSTTVGAVPLSGLLEEVGTNFSNYAFYNSTDINGTDSNELEDLIGPKLRIIILIVYNTISLFGIFWNLLIIAVLLSYQKMRSMPNIYILNLAVADLMFLTVLPFLSIWHAWYPKWMLGPAMCTIVMGFDGWNLFNSILFMVAMSIDRFCAVVIPFKSRSFRTTFHTYIICGCIWLASFLISLPLWRYSEFKFDGKQAKCLTPLPPFFGTYSFVLGFIIPLIIIAGCYGMILHRLMCIRGPDSNQPRTKTKQATFLVIIIVITFIILWLPFHLMQFMPTSMTTIIVCLTLSYANSCVNPMLYNIFGQNFRANTLQFLGCLKDKEKWKRRRTSKRSFTSHTGITSLRGKSITTSSSTNHSVECHGNGMEMHVKSKKTQEGHV